MRINLKHAVVEIHYPTGEICLIDREDLEHFGKHSWFINRAGQGQTQYLIRNGNNRTHQFHRDIMNPPAGMEIDHLNHNGLDNRKCNLAIVTHQQNQCNRPKNRNATTKFWGVYANKEPGRSNKFIAQAARSNGQRTTVCWGNDPYEVAIRRENWIIENGSNSKRNFE